MGVPFCSLTGRSMRKVDEFQFYRLATTIHPFTEIADDIAVISIFGATMSAKTILLAIWNDTFSPPLGVSRPACGELWQRLNNVVPDKFQDPAKEEAPFNFERVMPSWECEQIRKAAKNLETVLAAECQSLDTYFVSQKLAYDTRLLIEQAERLVPEGIRKELPAESIQDIQQAGRCIAFDIPTAAGFHIVRATETIIRKYYEFVTTEKPKAKMRNWGAYIATLERSGKADKRITGFLDHIRDEYRNPLLHPDEVLTTEQAQLFLNVCISSISQMVEAMRTPAEATLPFEVNRKAEAAGQ